VVDYNPQQVVVEDNTPLTPPGPEMRKVFLEGSVLKKEEVDMNEEDGGGGGGGVLGGINNLKEVQEDLKAPELNEEPKEVELKAEEAKKEQFEEIIVEPKEAVKEEVKEDDTETAAPAAAPVVVSFSDNPIEVYEDTIVDEEDNAPPPSPPPPEAAPEVEAIASTSSGETEESSSSSSGETESSSEEQSVDTEEEKEEEEESVVPFVAVAAVGTAAAGGAAATAASANEEPDVEMGGDPTETQAANDTSPPESSFLEEDDFSNPDEEMGEQFNLANEEHRNEVVPPSPDEEQGLQLNTEDTVAGAPLSPIAEKSVETNDPSFASADKSVDPSFASSSAATATKAAAVANSTNDETEQQQQQRRDLSSSSRQSSSCCKRHKCLTLFIILMILFVIAAVVLIVLFLVGPLKHPTSSEESSTSSLCDVWDLGPFYQSECETCSHTVAMDGDTGLIARGGEGEGSDDDNDESVQFITNVGTYIPGQTLPFISHEASALLGNYAALGDPTADGGLGTVHIYERDLAGVWSDVWNIRPDTLNGEGAKFGTAIVLRADEMVVGAPGDANEASTGSVYIFRRGDDGIWVQDAKIYQMNVTTGSFGSAVALKDDTLVIADASFPGTVYVYKYDSTINTLEQRIDGSLSSMDCRSTFGISVGVTDGGGILIECPKETTGAGAVYYYTPSSNGSGYELRQKITAFNEVPLPALGGKIVVDKDRLLVTTDAESVFVFELDAFGEWKEAASIAAPAGANDFGTDAALFGEHIFLSYGGNTHSYILDC